MFGILEAVSVPHSGIFNSYEDLFKELSDRMEKDGYKIVKARSHRGKVGGADVPGNDIVRCDLVCDRGGRPYRCMATKHKTTTKKTDCPWKAKAVHRKTMGGWVLTITCDQHNHEPGTPEPPTPEPASEDENNIVEDLEDDGPQPDAETQAAIHVAGVSNAVLRLTGDTFHQFKSEYRKMSQPERIGILSQLQLRIAAIYAVQNEDVQRQKRQEAQDKRHRQIEETKRQSSAQQKQRARQRRQVAEQTQQQQQQPQPPQQMHPQHVQQQPLPQQTSQAQVQAQQAQQAQQAAQAQAQAQAMMQSQLYLPQNPQQTPIPVPGMDMPQFQHYAGPPKRMRGRPSQGGQQT